MVEFLWWVGVVGMVLVAFGSAAFCAIARDSQGPATNGSEPSERPPRAVAAFSSEFFAPAPTAPQAPGSRQEQAKTAHLLRVLERHVRQEQIAVEAFLQSPSVKLLKSNPSSAPVR